MKNKSTTLQGVITFFMISSVIALVILYTAIAIVYTTAKIIQLIGRELFNYINY